MSSYAQEQTATQPIEKLSAKLEKANRSLSHKLEKLNRRLIKKLEKAYPQLKEVNLDSLMEERVYQAQQQDTSSHPTDSPTLATDSTWLQIQKLKAELLADQELTPGGLDLHQQMDESLAELAKTQELLKQWQMPGLPELPEIDLPALPNTPDPGELMSAKHLDKLKGELTGLKTLMDRYTQQFEGWPEELLNRATNLEEVKLLQNQKKLMDAYKPLPEGYRENMEGFQTNDFVKEKLQAKAEEIKKVGGKSIQERFTEAQAEMDEAKKKYSSLNSLSDTAKRQANPYAGQPLLKRLRWGGNFQVNRQEPTSIDAALSVSYLINARARLGLAGAYRVTTRKRITNLDFDNEVYTTRGFLDYTLFKTFYLEGLYEWSYTDVLDRNDISQGRQWVRSAMLGLGNRFTLTRGIQGNFVTLYNFSHDERSPYNSPWVFRVGFEF